MNYINTFITVAPDCPATEGVVPPGRGGTRSIPRIEYELLSCRPYHYTQEELQFAVYLEREGLAPTGKERQALWDAFFSKPRACLRTSALLKKYGWGLHFDEQGKIALVAVNTAEYRKFQTSKTLKVLAAARSSKKTS